MQCQIAVDVNLILPSADDVAVTGGKIFLVADPADQAEEYAKVAHELRNTFSLAYYSKNADRDGSMRKIRVEVRDPRYRVRRRTSYFVPKD